MLKKKKILELCSRIYHIYYNTYKYRVGHSTDCLRETLLTAKTGQTTGVEEAGEDVSPSGSDTWTLKAISDTKQGKATYFLKAILLIKTLKHNCSI